jgi:hypothetical protein
LILTACACCRRCGTLQLSAGSHTAFANFFENQGYASCAITWYGPDTNNAETLLTSSGNLNDLPSALEGYAVPSRWLMKTYNVGHWLSTMPDVTGLTLVGQTYVPEINFWGEEKFQAAIPGTPGDYFATTFQGRISVATAGIYTFCTNSDDGSDLTIDGSLVVDNGGLHGTTKKWVLSAYCLTAQCVL